MPAACVAAKFHASLRTLQRFPASLWTIIRPGQLASTDSRCHCSDILVPIACDSGTADHAHVWTEQAAGVISRCLPIRLSWPVELGLQAPCRPGLSRRRRSGCPAALLGARRPPQPPSALGRASCRRHLRSCGHRVGRCAAAVPQYAAVRCRSLWQPRAAAAWSSRRRRRPAAAASRPPQLVRH